MLVKYTMGVTMGASKYTMQISPGIYVMFALTFRHLMCDLLKQNDGFVNVFKAMR